MLPTLPPHPQRVRGPSTMIFTSAGDIMQPSPSLVVPSVGTSVARRRQRRLVLPSLSSLLISLFSCSLCRLCIALCSNSDNWWLGAQQLRTSMLLTQWCLYAAVFYDRLSRRMCLCGVALSCSHCNVVNQTSQIRCTGYRSAVALSSPMLQITANVWCPTSLSVWH